MRRLVGARRNRTVRRACMFSATAAAVVTLLVVAAPDTGTLASSSRLARGPETLSGAPSAQPPAPPAPVAGAPHLATESLSRTQPAPAATTTTSTTMLAGATPLAAGPEKVYG